MRRLGVIGGAMTGSLAGVLTRPCCVLPIALSTFGLSGAVVSSFVASHRPMFLLASITLLAGSLAVTLSREGGTAAKAITVTMAIAGFVVSRAWTGV